jgi:adenylate cyclase
LEAIRLANQAIEEGKDDPVALLNAGWTIAVLAGERALGLRAIDRAIALNPNSALGWGLKGWVEAISNRSAPAIEAARRAIRLSPLDPMRYWFDGALALACVISDRDEEGMESADQALTQNPRAVRVLGLKAITCVRLGRLEEASECVRRFRELRPGSTIANLEETMRAGFSPEVLAIYLDGLRKAGMPEE